MHLTKYSRLIYTLSFLFILFLFVVPNKVLATDYYVAGDTGLDTNNGSISTPWKTIQKAADTMVAGDTVNIKGNLTYTDVSDCGSPKANICITTSGTQSQKIRYQSWQGTGIPVIDDTNVIGNLVNGVNRLRAIVVDAEYIEVSGFKIVNPSIYGIYINKGNVVVSNNIIVDSSLSATAIGGSANGTKSVEVYNNTIDGFEYGLALTNFLGTTTVKNNSITNSSIYGISMYAPTSMYLGTITVDYNNVFNSGVKDFALGVINVGTHNLSVDPKFINSNDLDYSLTTSSPLINRGTSISNVTTDISGAIRPQEESYDIGAYESNFTNNNSNIVYYQPLNKIKGQFLLYSTIYGAESGSEFSDFFPYRGTEVGDVNRDGIDDLLVNSHAHYSSYSGVSFFYGSRNFGTTRSYFDSDAHIDGSQVGTSIAIFDANGDSHQDVYFASRGELNLSGLTAGVGFKFAPDQYFSGFHTVSDADGIIQTTDGEHTTSPGDSVGLGDINGDGINDYMFCYSPTLSQENHYLFYGTSELNNTHVNDADVTYIHSGSSTRIDGKGDLNNDSYDDIIIGDRVNSKVYIFKGGPSLENKNINSTDADITITGKSDDSYFGTDVVTSDLDRSGTDDVIVLSSKSIYIFYGSKDMSTMSAEDADVVIDRMDSDYPEISISMSTNILVEDINNDGYPDIGILNQILDRVHFFYGGGWRSKNISDADLISPVNLYGLDQYNILKSGDLNDDGYQEIVVTAVLYNEGQGRIQLFTPPHGTPTITTTSIGGVSTSGKITGTVTDSYTHGGVEFSFDGGSWLGCGLSGDNFSCNLPSSTPGSNHAVRLRYKNIHGVYIPEREYKEVNFKFLTTAGNNSSTSCTTTLNTNSTPSITNLKSLNNNTSVELTLQNNDTNATEYIIEYGTTKDNLNYSALNIPVSSKTYTINKLNPTKQYYFRVRTTNGCGFSNWSEPVEIKNYESRIKNLKTTTPRSQKLVEQSKEESEQVISKNSDANLFNKIINFILNLFGLK